MPRTVEILDTTLRDGAQGEGISYSLIDKAAIIKALDRLGVAIIEAGNPAANPKDAELFARVGAGEIKTRRSRIAAFGSTCRKNERPEDDPAVKALLDSGAQTVVIFGKSSLMHVTDVLQTTAEENLRMIRDTTEFFTSHGVDVIFDAEHFFDGFLQDQDYAVSALGAARDGGASRLVLCDTNGGCFPDEIGEITRRIVSKFDIPIGIHCHNDGGMAVASTVAAVEAGARHVQGTLLGTGERCGNASLSVVIPNLQLKRYYICIPDDGLRELTHTARQIADLSNISVPPGSPYVGRSAFAHKAGMHADGVHKLTRSFEHIDPSLVGNERRFPVSEMAGRRVILDRALKFAPSLDKSSPETEKILAEVKELERDGYEFEGAEASFELLMRRAMGAYKPSFRLESCKMISEQPVSGESASVMIKIEVNGRSEMTAAEGEGPVHALDRALRKALEVFYPDLERTRLVDYKVRVLDPHVATAAKVRVLITSTDGMRTWTTVGVSADILEASWLSLVDSMEYILQSRNSDGSKKEE